MSDAAPWESAPIDFGAAGTMTPPVAPGSQGDDARPLTIRPRGNGALPTPTATPSDIQSAAPPTAPVAGLASAVAALPAPAAAAEPWANAPVDTDAPSWLDTAKDVAQSAASGVERGAIGALTAPVAIGDYLKGKFSGGMDWVLGPKPDQPAPTPGTLDDVAQNLGSYIGPAGATRGLEAVAGPLYVPQTTAGKYAETAGEFIPGAAGGGIPGALKYGVIPGLASEAAGQATAGTPLETPARIIAPLLAGGGIALAGGPGAAGKVLRDAAGPLDPSTLQAAQGLMDTARAQGAPITLTEGLQQVTNGGTRLGALQRVVEQSRGGADTMAKFYADRPAQVQQAGQAAIDRVGPVPAVPFDGSMGPVRPNPSAVGPAVQQAAQGALDATPQGQAAAQALAVPRVTPEQAGQTIQPALRQVYDQHLAARSAQARTDYAAAAADAVPADQISSIIDDLGARIAADKTGLLAKPLGDLRSRLIDRSAPKASQWELDPAGGATPVGAPTRSFAPVDETEAIARTPRPAMSRPASLVSFLQSAGGVRDPGGDLKAMGLDRFPGLVRVNGGLSPDMARQAAAQAGYLGAHIDGAMADTTVNDLLSALENHPHYSVLDDEATHAWESYDRAQDERNRVTGPTSQGAAPPRGPGLPDADPNAPVKQPPTPITDVENLNRVRKYFRDRIDLPQIAPKAIDKETAATIGPVLHDLDATMAEGSSAYRQANRNFQAGSVPLAPFEHTPALASAIERDPYGTRFTTPAEQVPGLIDRGGSSAARAFTSVAPDPARQAYENHLTSQILDAATGPRGALDADKLAGAVRDNADVLQQFPAVRARVQQVIDTQRATAPLRDTLVGRLAATRDFREQAAAILDTNPLPGSENEVGEAVRQVAARSPAAAQALVSQRIRQVFNEATQDNMGGPNQWGGAKFNAVIRGNDQQGKNLKAAIEALHGPRTWHDFQRTLDVFEAMGRRQAAGSMTEPNRQISKELQKGGKIGELATGAVSPADWLGKARELYDGFRYGRNTKALADMLTRPDAAKALSAIAKAGPHTAKAQGLAAIYLLNTAAQQGRKAIP